MERSPYSEPALVGNEKQNLLNVYKGGRNEYVVGGCRVGPFFIDFFSIEYCQNGAYTILLNDIPYEISEGDLYIIPPSSTFEYFYTADVSSKIHVAVTGIQLSKYFNALGFTAENIKFPHPLTKNCIALLDSIVDSLEIIEMFTLKDPSAPQLVQFVTNKDFTNSFSDEAVLKQVGYLNLFLSELMSIRGKFIHSSTKKSQQEKYIDIAVRYIETNYPYDITVDTIAKHIGITRGYLFRLFREALGISPKEYIVRVRMRVACEYLSRPGALVKNAAAAVNYDTFSFSRVFKQIIGMTPSEYQQKYGK